MIYLDEAATTPVRRDVLEAMWPYLTGEFGNPSSHHTVGEAAARALAEARASVAGWLGCRPGEVIFTSGGTEADNLAIKGIALASPRGRHIVTSPIEHEAVLESVHYLERFHGFATSYLKTDSFGLVDPDELARTVRDDTTLVSVMLANNEIGTVEPIAELSAVARARQVPFHTDAVQAAGSLDLNVNELGVDALSLSGHKLGAPKGIGVLYLRARVRLEPILHGGGQERERRSGTENVAGAVGLAAAMRAVAAQRAGCAPMGAVPAREAAARDSFVRDSAVRESAVRESAARDSFVAAVLAGVPGAQLTGHPQRRLPASASFVFPGTSGESVLLELERRGVISSSGSACAAGSDDASHVLIALGYSEEIARTAVRFTWGSEMSGEMLQHVADAVVESVAAVAAIAPIAS